MNIYLYKNTDEKNKLNKTLIDIGAITGNQKEESSIINPSFMVLNSNNAIVANYLFADELSRYYFINSVKSVNGGMIILDCSIDVLMSWKSDILKLNVVTARQQNQYNTYLPDSEYKAYNNPIITQKAFPYGFKSDSNLILSVAGGGK